MTNKEKILNFLRAKAPEEFSISEIGSHTGIEQHSQVFQITRSLKDKKLIQGQQYGKKMGFLDTEIGCRGKIFINTNHHSGPRDQRFCPFQNGKIG
ncbi:MAG: hypothetical protein WB930_11890 [Syntrophobacteraceae bacterium]